jgi:hypothetical protein
MIAMDRLPRVTLSGDVEGDYVVLQRRSSGMLRIAPERSEGLLRVAALKRTCTACPSQWEGALEDGRTVYARYRHGELSVGVGDDIDDAVRNGMSDRALYADHVGDGLDGFMDFEELKVHLYGLLEFPAALVVGNERQPSLDAQTREKPFAPPQED